MMNFSKSRLASLLQWLSSSGEGLSPGETVSFLVSNPDGFRGCYTGTVLSDGRVIHSYQSIQDLAELTGFKMNTPEKVDGGLIRIVLEKLDSNTFWPPKSRSSDGYGLGSAFSGIQKAEEPWFHISFLRALQDVAIQPGWKVLNLGMNRGDEIRFLKEHLSSELFSSLIISGVDWNEDVVRHAGRRFEKEANIFVQCGDLRDVDGLGLDAQDLIISIDTLQSSGLNGRELILTLRKKLLKPCGAFILGFPNTRYLDGTLHYGARMRNYTEPELSLMIRDLFFYRRYLQQQGFVVKITGKYTVFLTAIKTA